jgi:hypothetical protein
MVTLQGDAAGACSCMTARTQYTCTPLPLRPPDDFNRLQLSGCAHILEVPDNHNVCMCAEELRTGAVSSQTGRQAHTTDGTLCNLLPTPTEGVPAAHTLPTLALGRHKLREGRLQGRGLLAPLPVLAELLLLCSMAIVPVLHPCASPPREALHTMLLQGCEDMEGTGRGKSKVSLTSDLGPAKPNVILAVAL